ncbi:MAG: hypothetical protein SGI74_10965 [Oligoflexia bacterium]|nr:hypothetical protein [Oligoflexia bacterium]
MKLKLVFILLFLVQAITIEVKAQELPNTSYPYYGRYSRCENSGDTKRNLGRNNWAFSVTLEFVTAVNSASPLDFTTSALEYDRWVDFKAKPATDSEYVLVKTLVREVRCKHLPRFPNEFRYTPILRDQRNRVEITCKHKAFSGGYKDEARTLDSGIITMPRNSNAFEYYDTYGQRDFLIPIKECLNKVDLKRYENGELVDLTLITRYLPQGKYGPKYASRLETITVSK